MCLNFKIALKIIKNHNVSDGTVIKKRQILVCSQTKGGPNLDSFLKHLRSGILVKAKRRFLFVGPSLYLIRGVAQFVGICYYKVVNFLK